MEWTMISDLDELKAKFADAGSKPVFVDFMAEWCGNCEKINDTLEEVAEANQEKALFLKVDVDEAEDVAEEYEVTALPRVICFKNGEPAGAMFGNKEEKY